MLVQVNLESMVIHPLEVVIVGEALVSTQVLHRARPHWHVSRQVPGHDVFDQCVCRMVCQNQRDGRLVIGYIWTLWNDGFTSCNGYSFARLLNDVWWVVKVPEEKNDNFFALDLEILLLTTDAKVAVGDGIPTTDRVRRCVIHVGMGVGFLVIYTGDETIRCWFQTKVEKWKLLIRNGPGKFEAGMKAIYKGGKIFDLLRYFLRWLRQYPRYTVYTGVVFFPGIDQRFVPRYDP